MADPQFTLAKRVSLSGIGVHSGKHSDIHVNPAPADTGIQFQRIGQNSPARIVPAHFSEVDDTDLCTIIGRAEGETVATVEHLMAALCGLGIDNALVEVDGAEVPILDGSAANFVEAFLAVGLIAQDTPRRYLRVLKPVRVENGQSWAELLPHDATRYEVEIDFSTPAIGRQSHMLDLEGSRFADEVARARTFGFIKDVEFLWANGLALGSSLENSVVIGTDDRVINSEGLRYPDEFARHKTLDAVGDLALAGRRFLGHYRSYRGGHKINAAVLRALHSDASAYEIVTLEEEQR